jgi:predicted adenine nucleotide alpha hydrolase (AANH) superfamily ATPase
MELINVSTNGKTVEVDKECFDAFLETALEEALEMNPDMIRLHFKEIIDEWKNHQTLNELQKMINGEFKAMQFIREAKIYLQQTPAKKEP